MATKKKTTRSKNFDKYAKRYKHGGCTKEQLEQLVVLGILMADECKDIIRVSHEEY